MWNEILVRNYPRTFSRLSYFECNSGWQNIIAEAASVIEEYNRTVENQENWVTASQVKEKFGTLRFYIDTWQIAEDKYAEIAAAVAEAERKSKTTCEACGSPEGTLRLQNRYHRVTLCDKCNV